MPRINRQAPFEQFEGPNIENDEWFANLPEERRNEVTAFVNSANSDLDVARRDPSVLVPLFERLNSIQEYCEANPQVELKLNSSNVNVEALYALEKTLSRVVYDADVFNQLMVFGNCSTVLTGADRRWAIKEYLLDSQGWPVFTQAFRNPTYIHLRESSQYKNAMGMAMGISMNWVDMAMQEGGLWDPYVETLRELGVKFGVHHDRYGWLGTACANAVNDDGASVTTITGLYNDAGNQSFASGAGADNDVTADGDMAYSIEVAMDDLSQQLKPGKRVLVTTKGPATETVLQIHDHAYTNESEYSQIKRKYFTGGNAGIMPVCDAWFVSQGLNATNASAPAVNTGGMMLADIGPGLIEHKILFPMQLIPLQNKMFPSDIHEVMLTADVVQIRKQNTSVNCVPITVATGAITSTRVGFVRAGRFM